MINKYFADFELTLSDFFFITEQSVKKIRRGSEIGIIKGKLYFTLGSIEFIEVVKFETSNPKKVKYSYHFMNDENEMIFRYDNAKHHPEINTFPHHKHVGNTVNESKEPDIFLILKEIQRFINKT